MTPRDGAAVGADKTQEFGVPERGTEGEKRRTVSATVSLVDAPAAAVAPRVSNVEAGHGYDGGWGRGCACIHGQRG